jgi:hypothetical protein
MCGLNRVLGPTGEDWSHDGERGMVSPQYAPTPDQGSRLADFRMNSEAQLASHS